MFYEINKSFIIEVIENIIRSLEGNVFFERSHGQGHPMKGFIPRRLNIGS